MDRERARARVERAPALVARATRRPREDPLPEPRGGVGEGAERRGGFLDCEGICWLYDDKFAISDEDTSQITIVTITPVTASLTKAGGTQLPKDVPSLVLSPINYAKQG